MGRRDTSLPFVAQRKADKDNQMGKTQNTCPKLLKTSVTLIPLLKKTIVLIPKVRKNISLTD